MIRVHGHAGLYQQGCYDLSTGMTGSYTAGADESMPLAGLLSTLNCTGIAD